jgi:hypothetical protein
LCFANSGAGDRPIDLALHLLYSGKPLPPASPTPSRPKIVPLSAITLDAHAGQYRLESNQICRVTPKHDLLLLDISGDGVLKLFPSSPREFFSNNADLLVVFETDANNATTGFTLHEEYKQQLAARSDTRPSAYRAYRTAIDIRVASCTLVYRRFPSHSRAM